MCCSMIQDLWRHVSGAWVAFGGIHLGRLHALYSLLVGLRRAYSATLVLNLVCHCNPYEGSESPCDVLRVGMIKMPAALLEYPKPSKEPGCFVDEYKNSHTKRRNLSLGIHRVTWANPKKCRGTHSLGRHRWRSAGQSTKAAARRYALLRSNIWALRNLSNAAATLFTARSTIEQIPRVIIKYIGI